VESTSHSPLTSVGSWAASSSACWCKARVTPWSAGGPSRDRAAAHRGRGSPSASRPTLAVGDPSSGRRDALL